MPEREMPTLREQAAILKAANYELRHRAAKVAAYVTALGFVLCAWLGFWRGLLVGLVIIVAVEFGAGFVAARHSSQSEGDGHA